MSISAHILPRRDYASVGSRRAAGPAAPDQVPAGAGGPDPGVPAPHETGARSV